VAGALDVGGVLGPAPRRHLRDQLDPYNCLEVLIVRGQAARIKQIADELIAAKGVKHGKLTLTSTGTDLPG
jgi:CopG family transcriptional regulator, nickel-responsive regulator